MAILTLESGRIQKPMVMEFIYGKMEIAMKVNGEDALNTEKELIYFLMEIFMLVIIKMESSKGMANIFGQMHQFMTETLKMVLSMEEGNGGSKRTI
jgi:hypothetical protein